MLLVWKYCSVSNIRRTFNLPNTAERTFQGNSNGYIEAGLPNITGGFGYVTTGSGRESYTKGVFSLAYKGSSVSTFGSNNGYRDGYTIDASLASPIYGNSETVQPNAILTNFIIKY